MSGSLYWRLSCDCEVICSNKSVEHGEEQHPCCRQNVLVEEILALRSPTWIEAYHAATHCRPNSVVDMMLSLYEILFSSKSVVHRPSRLPSQNATAFRPYSSNPQQQQQQQQQQQHGQFNEFFDEKQ
jgi:hypothetical protein